MPREIPGKPLSPYKYDNPDDAYIEAQRRIKQAKDEEGTLLDLMSFGLTAVPPEIGQLIGLTDLWLHDNQLTTVPSEIGLLSELETLNLENNLLSAIPPEIWQLTSLRRLFLGSNQLFTVPPEIRQLPQLKELNLYNTQLTIIPPEIGQLKKLSYLGLQFNQIMVIPPEIWQLPQLTKLHLSGNPLKNIPSEIWQLTRLAELGLNGVQLTFVPSAIGQLTKLTGLWLGENKLITVPPQIKQLTKLKRLHLQENQLKTIPPEITQLKNLDRLTLEGNPDLLIPPEVLVQGENAQAILNYLRDRQEASARPLNEAKLILVGQGSVGKTSLVKRLLGQEFDEAENQTEGINIETWSLDVNRPQQGLVPIALNIWDFGGQEIMHATHQFFLTKRSLYLLVLDARQGEDEGRVEYWLALINSFAPEAPVLIVINKSDQHHLDINRRGLQEKYPAIKGFIRTSARNASGIDELKTEITNILATMEHVDTAFPASWMQVKTDLVEMQNQRHFLPYDEYEDLCHQHGIKEESSQTTLVRFLHDLGIVLNFTDDDRVRDTSVLNPNW